MIFVYTKNNISNCIRLLLYYYETLANMVFVILNEVKDLQIQDSSRRSE